MFFSPLLSPLLFCSQLILLFDAAVDGSNGGWLSRTGTPTSFTDRNQTSASPTRQADATSAFGSCSASQSSTLAAIWCVSILPPHIFLHLPHFSLSSSCGSCPRSTPFPSPCPQN